MIIEKDMICKITNTTELHDTYYEDIDATVNTKKQCYLINCFYYRYFSTLKAAREFARKRGMSERLAN